LLPIVALLASPARWHIAAIASGSLVSLALLGALGAYLGGARVVPATLRVTFGGSLAMGVTAIVGHFLGAAVG
jgi:vacuolar iron transporter family protein